jgi:exfoliative toxin A/B
MTIVWFLTALSIIMYAAALVMLPRLLRLKFYPSFAAFTFPLIISAIGMKQAEGFLTKEHQVVPLLKYLVYFQVLTAVMVTFYVLFKYLQFLIVDNKEESTTPEMLRSNYPKQGA